MSSNLSLTGREGKKPTEMKIWHVVNTSLANRNPGQTSVLDACATSNNTWDMFNISNVNHNVQNETKKWTSVWNMLVFPCKAIKELDTVEAGKSYRNVTLRVLLMLMNDRTENKMLAVCLLSNLQQRELWITWHISWLTGWNNTQMDVTRLKGVSVFQHCIEQTAIITFNSRFFQGANRFKKKKKLTPKINEQVIIWVDTFSNSTRL